LPKRVGIEITGMKCNDLNSDIKVSELSGIDAAHISQLKSPKNMQFEFVIDGLLIKSKKKALKSDWASSGLYTPNIL
jgi:hypothetical protein